VSEKGLGAHPPLVLMFSTTGSSENPILTEKGGPEPPLP
jgi:hypothetical protein